MTDTRAAAALEALDRGVVLFAVGGVIFNGIEASLTGLALTATAALGYGLMRNRMANLENFALLGPIPAPPGVNLQRFTGICKWLGSRQLFDGLLGDLVDPDIGGDDKAARRYLRQTLWPAIWTRTWEKLLSLFRP